MSRARIVIKATLEYEIPRHFYPEEWSLEKCLQADVKNAIDDPVMFLEMEDIFIEVSGELI